MSNIEHIKQELMDYLEPVNEREENPSYIAKLLKDLKAKDSKSFIEYLDKVPHDLLGEVALELPISYLEEALEVLKIDKFTKALKELDSDDATDLLQIIAEIDNKYADTLLQNLDLEDQININTLKKYKEDEAGAYMQTELLKANYEDKIQHFINKLKSSDLDFNTIIHLLIVNNKNHLLMVLPISYILTLDFEKTFEDIWPEIPEEYIPYYSYDTDKINDIVQKFEEYDLSVLPILDESKSLVGRITYDDIYDVIQDRATEQMYNLAGVDDEAEEDEDLFKTIKTRFNWLFINLLTAIAASIAIGFFSHTLDQLVALAILMPIVASMGGNSGTQTLAVTVRKIALGDIEKKDAFKVIKKEVIISFANSIVFAIFVGIITFFWFASIKLAMVIGVAMILNLIIAGFVGAITPLLLKYFNIDPAIGSSVVLTTATDIVGFVSFLWLAKIILL